MAFATGAGIARGARRFQSVLPRSGLWLVLVAAGCGKAPSASIDAGAAAPAASVEPSARPRPAATAEDVAPAEPEDVSIVVLLAEPERFRGRRVRVAGYANLEFEGNAVYLHEDDFRHFLTKNGLWLALDGTPFARREGRLGYAYVEGTFDPDGLGHFGAFGGTLRDVGRLEPIRVPPR